MRIQKMAESNNQLFYSVHKRKAPFYAGDNGAELLARALGADNYQNTGTLDSNFYLTKMKDPDAAISIPQYI